MEYITHEYLVRGGSWLFITTLCYFLVNGAQVFETLVVVPKWTASPPQSFSYLSDRNGMSLKTFWITFHSLHEISFILAMVFCWKLVAIRNWLSILFVVHMAIRVWTIAYFAPRIIGFEQMTENSDDEGHLAARVLNWKRFNYIRVGFFIILSLALVPVLIKMVKLGAFSVH